MGDYWEITERLLRDYWKITKLEIDSRILEIPVRIVRLLERY